MYGMVVEQEGGWTHNDGFPGGGSEGIRTGGPPVHPLLFFASLPKQEFGKVTASF